MVVVVAKDLKPLSPVAVRVHAVYTMMSYFLTAGMYLLLYCGCLKVSLAVVLLFVYSFRHPLYPYGTRDYVDDCGLMLSIFTAIIITIISQIAYLSREVMINTNPFSLQEAVSSERSDSIGPGHRG